MKTFSFVSRAVTLPKAKTPSSSRLEKSAMGSKAPPEPNREKHVEPNHSVAVFDDEDDEEIDDFPVDRRRRMSMSDVDEYKRRTTWSAEDAKTRIGAAALEVIEAEQALHQLRMKSSRNTGSSSASSNSRQATSSSRTNNSSGRNQPLAPIREKHVSFSVTEEDENEAEWRRQLRAAQRKEQEQRSIEDELKADLDDLLFFTSQVQASKKMAARRAASTGHRRMSLELVC